MTRLCVVNSCQRIHCLQLESAAVCLWTCLPLIVEVKLTLYSLLAQLTHPGGAKHHQLSDCCLAGSTLIPELKLTIYPSTAEELQRAYRIYAKQHLLKTV